MLHDVKVTVLEQLAYPEVCVLDDGYHSDDIILCEHRLGSEVIVSIQHLYTYRVTLHNIIFLSENL